MIETMSETAVILIIFITAFLFYCHT